MENHNNIELQGLPPEKVQELQLSIRYFFVEYPPEELKSLLWNMYTAWICNSAEHSVKKEIVDMLLFYEAMLKFTAEVNDYCGHLEKTSLAGVLIK